MKKLLLLLFISTLTLTAFGQKTEKLFYDEEWKVVPKQKAEFYRILTFDSDNNPVGPIKDYFITGELQGVAEGALYIDKFDDAKSIFTGTNTGYFRTGNKQFEQYFDNQGNLLRAINYYENGNKRTESNFNKGVYHGDYLSFYESGKLYRKFDFANGELSSKFFTECDEFGSCEKIFLENFSDDANPNEWPLYSDKDVTYTIIAGEGLLMKSNTENFGYKQSLHVPLTLTEDFSIETITNFKDGDDNSGYGLVWGFKDWDNFFYFQISANGFYRIGGETESINIEFKEWTPSEVINKNKQRNHLKILRYDETIYFSINGELVHSDSFYSFRGNHIGFYMNSKKEVLFETLIVKQELPSEQVTTNVQGSNREEWSGNGTGVFISKDGYLATNYHVISEISAIEVEFIRNGQRQNYEARVVQSDRQNDLAVLKISDPDFSPLPELPYNFKTGIAEVGTNVFALGYPMALTVMGTEIKFTDGKISSKTGFQGDISTYQTTTPIQPGNSGGPLFDFDGSLIGINSAILRPDVADNVSYSIKSSYLKNLVDVLPNRLSLPKDTSLANKTLTEKIRILSDFVVLIRTR